MSGIMHLAEKELCTEILWMQVTFQEIMNEKAHYQQN